MEIVKNHFLPGKPVESFGEIKDVAFQMVELLNGGLMSEGLIVAGHGLAHNQVEDTQPLSFFVLSDKSLREQKWPSQFILNPQILEPERTINIGTEDKPDVRSNIKTYSEGCFSFPHKAPKNMERYFQIKVKYQIPVNDKKLKDVTEVLEGLKAHIFQHEWSHCIGENIYYKKNEQK